MTIPELIQRLFVLLLLFSVTTQAQSLEHEAGEVVIRHGVIDEDLYLAGAQVELYAAVTGDAVVAGGQLNLEGDIGGDVLAAGGTIALRSSVNDDARLAGGELRVAGRVGGDLLAAGGRIHLGPVSAVTGSALLAGGDMRIDGTIEQGLNASGGRVVITGTINGNVELWAEQIIIEKTAVITGSLHYKSPREAQVESGVRIDGEVVYTPVDVDIKPVVASALLAGLVLLISIILSAVVLYLLFPDFSMHTSQSLKEAPWLSLGLGLAVFAGIPVLITILFSTMIGTLLALILLVVYLVLLLAGYFIGALFVANAGLNLLGKAGVSKSGVALALAVAILVLAIVGLLPVVGGLVSWVALLAGLGALSRQIYLAYRV
jgi:cytoskeletal protein CcmA (bactofilin family)